MPHAIEEFGEPDSVAADEGSQPPTVTANLDSLADCQIDGRWLACLDCDTTAQTNTVDGLSADETTVDNDGDPLWMRLEDDVPGPDQQFYLLRHG